MHSSRVRTARSRRRLLVGVCLSACWDTPLGVDLETPPPVQTPQLPPWVWAWRPARYVGIPPPPTQDLQGMLGYHLQWMLGIPAPPCVQNS